MAWQWRLLADITPNRPQSGDKIIASKKKIRAVSSPVILERLPNFTRAHMPHGRRRGNTELRDPDLVLEPSTNRDCPGEERTESSAAPVTIKGSFIRAISMLSFASLRPRIGIPQTACVPSVQDLNTHLPDAWARQDAGNPSYEETNTNAELIQASYEEADPPTTEVSIEYQDNSTEVPPETGSSARGGYATRSPIPDVNACLGICIDYLVLSDVST